MHLAHRFPTFCNAHTRVANDRKRLQRFRICHHRFSETSVSSRRTFPCSHMAESPCLNWRKFAIPAGRIKSPLVARVSGYASTVLIAARGSITAMLFELAQGLSGIPPAVVRRGNPWRVVRRNTTRTTESVHTTPETHRLGARPDLRRAQCYSMLRLAGCQNP